MASFYHLFNRFLAEKAKGEKLYVPHLTSVTGRRSSRLRRTRLRPMVRFPRRMIRRS